MTGSRHTIEDPRMIDPTFSLAEAATWAPPVPPPGTERLAAFEQQNRVHPHLDALLDQLSGISPDQPTGKHQVWIAPEGDYPINDEAIWFSWSRDPRTDAISKLIIERTGKPARGQSPIGYYEGRRNRREETIRIDMNGFGANSPYAYTHDLDDPSAHMFATRVPVPAEGYAHFLLGRMEHALPEKPKGRVARALGRGALHRSRS